MRIEIVCAPIEIELPDNVFERVERLTREKGISLDRLMVVALIEKLSTLFPNEALEARSNKGTWEGFDEFMNAVPDVDPEPPDTLPKPSK